MNIPVIRIAIEGMRQEMLYAFSRYTDDVEKAVDSELSKVVSQFNFEKTVSEAARCFLESEVRKITESVIREALWDPDMRKTLKEMMLKTLEKDILRERGKG